MAPAATSGPPRVSGAVVSALCRQSNQADEAEDVNKNAPSVVVEGLLYLGDVDNACSLYQLQHFGITHVLSITTAETYGEHQGRYMSNMNTRLFLYLADAEDADISVFFDKACSWIDEVKIAGGRVLVHCMAGRSRSATLVLAYLMRSERMSLLDAFLHAKRRRPIVAPNIGFWTQLRKEELRLFHANSEEPSHYVSVMAFYKEKADVTPGSLYKKFLVAARLSREEVKRGEVATAAEIKKEVLEMWCSAWPAAGSVKDIFMASMDELGEDARSVAVDFVSALLTKGYFTGAEVAEGFALLQSLDNKEDLKMDWPRLDLYIEEMLCAATVQGLLPPRPEA